LLKSVLLVDWHRWLEELLDTIQGHRDLPLSNCILVKAHLVSYHLSLLDLVSSSKFCLEFGLVLLQILLCRINSKDRAKMGKG
jgi:hypothetical protein